MADRITVIAEANTKKAADELAAKEKAENDALYMHYQGTGHWVIKNNFCVQLNGRKVGNKVISASLYSSFGSGKPPPLKKDLCMLNGFTKRGNYYNSLDGVIASIYTKEKK